MQLKLPFVPDKIDRRKLNRTNSPKQGGTSDNDALPYLKELGIEISEKKQSIQFTENINDNIHRWAPYVQGFSASFVQSQLDLYRQEYKQPIILDPFAGCGTVLVQAKLNGITSYGLELNPLLQFIADTKVNSWSINPDDLLKTYKSMPKNKISTAPDFIRSHSHFNRGVLRNLEIIKGDIDSLSEENDSKRRIKNLIKVAFSSILIDCSNLKRSPCLGYDRYKKIYDTAPFDLLNDKIRNIAEDLRQIQTNYPNAIHTNSKIFLADAMKHNYTDKFDLVITSPPYMNGLDYVMNYKIEMGWLGFVKNRSELRKIKDDLVVCDNVSKGLIQSFSNSKSIYTNEWIEEIKENITQNIERRGSYRRPDMPYIVHKYFDDLHKVMKNVSTALNKKGRFILVVGDSLIADVYVPTDLLIAKIGKDLGLSLEKVEKARERRSGQIRSYKLRESIITLKN